MKEKEALSNVGYYVEVSGSDGKTLIWELLNNHVV